MKNPFFILCTPRAGTNAVCHYLNNYFNFVNKKNYKHPAERADHCLWEYFRVAHLARVRIHQGNPLQHFSIKNIPHDQNFYYDFPLPLDSGFVKFHQVYNSQWFASPRTMSFELNRRIELLKISFQRGHLQFFKCFPGDILASESLTDFLRSNYEVITLQRRNLLLQFASFIRANRTNEWHIEPGAGSEYAPIPPRSVRIDTKEFDHWAQEYILPFEVVTKVFKKQIVAKVFYEDIESDIRKIGPILGLANVPALEVQNIRNTNRDLDWIENLEEVQSWFQQGPQPTPSGLVKKKKSHKERIHPPDHSV